MGLLRLIFKNLYNKMENKPTVNKYFVPVRIYKNK